MTIRLFTAIALMLPASIAQASITSIDVPEATTTGSIAALAAVAAVGAIAWERRRRGPRK